MIPIKTSFNVAEQGAGSYRMLAILRWVMVVIFVSFGMQKFTPQSAEGIVCAGQRMSQEGSSPSGARMRSAVSKGGGNASPASGESRWKTGCPERSGIRRV
jgi:hypothetical protein